MTGVLAEGQLIAGKYRLQRKLGEGGLGQVWRATHELLRGEVALKFLKASSDEKNGNHPRFLREARAASVLRSPHVCRVHDVGEHQGMPYLVMEYLEGEDFGTLLDHCGTVTPGLASAIAVQVCEALEEAHELGIFHRDLKPENLVLTWREENAFVKVVDFGLATSDDPATHGRITTTESTFGTPLYMAPEQMRSAREADARSDIWSMGVSLFVATSGQFPFHARSFQQLCVEVATVPAPPLASVWPKAPSHFAAVVDRCLAHNPDDRFQSARELRAALAPLAVHEGRPQGIPPLRVPEPRRTPAALSSISPSAMGKRNSRPPSPQATVTLVALGVAIALGTYMLSTKRHPVPVPAAEGAEAGPVPVAPVHEEPSAKPPALPTPSAPSAEPSAKPKGTKVSGSGAMPVPAAARPPGSGPSGPVATALGPNDSPILRRN